MGTNKFNLPKDFFKQFKDKEDFGSFFNDLYKHGIEQMLQGELDDHLGYEKHDKKGYNTGNSRNGYSTKTVKTENLGDIVLNIPRDRNGEFEPLVVPKGQTMTDKLEEAIISMYSHGMTTSDISSQVKEIYGVNVSETTISNVTERINELVKNWQQRALESVYLTVWMDGIMMKVRHNGKYINMCVFIVIGLKNTGHKEVLGMWIEENESASFWLKVLTDLKARGVEDILIACTDNFKGFTDAIKGVFPRCITQLCIIHQIRNSCKYIVWKDRKEFCADLKNVYAAINLETAQDALVELDNKWSKKYYYAIKSWKENWANLTAYFDYPMEIRTIIYTTNTIENLNRGIRKYTKTKVQFPDEISCLKSVYLAIMKLEKNWTKPIKNWGLICHQFLINFADRCKVKI
jgi:transposase-like protein